MKTNLSVVKIQTQLLPWYQQHFRDLPWRQDRNPYRVWISEVMLQQTTVQVVVPYYERFLKRFQTLEDLADANVESVLEMWAGLGYYSRAKLLHRSAQELVKRGGFPTTTNELLEMPGFGPYTARAVASLSFGDRVGVLDGNVIRVLSRLTASGDPWWTTKVRNSLQELADKIGDHDESGNINQAMMELGATVCTPTKPSCLICPLRKECRGLKTGNPTMFPAKRPKPEGKTILWTMDIYQNKGKIWMGPSTYTPFLKGSWLPPGKVQELKTKPKDFDIKHGITKYDIFIQLRKIKKSPPKQIGHQWIPTEDIKRWNPSSVLKKILQSIENQ